MRPLIIFATITALFLMSCDKDEKKVDYLAKITYKSKASFYRTLESINWKEFNPPDPSDFNVKEPCYPNLLEILESLPDIEVNREDAVALLRIYVLPVLIEQDVENGSYAEIEGADIKLIPTPIQDRILRKIDRGLSMDEFVDEVKGNGDLSSSDEVKLEMLYQIYHETLKFHSARFLDRTTSVKNCSVRETLDVKIDSVMPNQQKMSFKVLRTARINCECSDESGNSELKYASFNLETTIYASYAEKGLLNLIFSEWNKPAVKTMYVDCCRKKDKNSEEEEPDSEKKEEPGGN